MFHEKDMILDELSTVLGTVLHERDAYTQLHGDRVGQLAVTLGRAAGLSTLELSQLHAAALLHDIGKIGIPDTVLYYPGTLNADQLAVMRTHAGCGERILRTIPGEDTDTIATSVRHHHEDFDGGGYPDGIAGEEIPVMSRIISIVDNYDAMATRRVYHRAHGHAEIISVMDKDRGHKHDPYLLSKFMQVIESSPLRVN